MIAVCSVVPSGTQGLASPELLAGDEYPVDSTAPGDSSGKALSVYSSRLGATAAAAVAAAFPAPGSTPAGAGHLWSPVGGERTRNDSSYPAIAGR